MVKRLRRNTDDQDESIRHNIDPALASGPSKDKPAEQGNTGKMTEDVLSMVHDADHHAMAVRCTLPPHQPALFPTQSDFETHYQKDHANRCSACGRNFPTEHYMNLHIAENHDPINEVLRQKHERIVLLGYSQNR